MAGTYARYSSVGGSGGGGGGGIDSINGDTTSAQVIAGGTGISVSTSGGTTTITNTEPGPSTSIPNLYYVNPAVGNDANSGSINAPKATIQGAATAIGAASSTSVYNDPTQAYYYVKCIGTFTESPTFGTRPHIVLDMTDAVMVGNLTLDFDQSILGSGALSNAKFVITGSDLRSAYSGAGIPLTGISGNVTVQSITAGGSLTHQLHLINSGITGNYYAYCNAPANASPFTALVLMENAFVVGTINTLVSYGFAVSSANATAGATYTNNGQTFTVLDTIVAGTELQTTGTGAPTSSGTLTLASGTGDATITFSGVSTLSTVKAELYASNVDTSGSHAIGGMNGSVAPYHLRNVLFTGPIVTNFGASGSWTDVQFFAGANNFTGASATVAMDANSFNSWSVNVPSKGSITATLIDTAIGVGYSPGTSGNWSPDPTTAAAGLDQIAAQLSPFTKEAWLFSNPGSNSIFLLQQGEASANSGSLNMGFGRNTLIGANSSEGNIAFGVAVLKVYTGNEGLNTGFGFEPLIALASGGFNTAFGTSVFAAATTMNGGTGVGSGVGSLLSSGDYNSFFGYVAGSGASSWSGSYNALFGANCFTLVTSTSSSVAAFGSGAASSQTQYNNSVFVGVNADAASNNLTNAMALGYNSTVTASNTIMMGSSSVTDLFTSARLNTSTAQTTLTATGTAVCSQPFGGSSYKKVVIYLNGYTDTGTQTYIYPVAFTNTPYVYGLTAGVAGATATTTSVTFTVTTQTGFVFIEGY
jgi:hypothetical protein